MGYYQLKDVKSQSSQQSSSRGGVQREMNQKTAHFPHPFRRSGPDPASPSVSVENRRKETQGELEVHREEDKMR